MRAYEREAIVMVADLCHIHLPAEHGVALFAVGSELAAMNVGVAIGAARTRVAEYQAGVALGATDILVKTAQWVPSLVVIELGLAADRLPTCKGMAVLAGAVEITVRAFHVGARRRAILRPGTFGHQERNERNHNCQYY